MCFFFVFRAPLVLSRNELREWTIITQICCLVGIYARAQCWMAQWTRASCADIASGGPTLISIFFSAWQADKGIVSCRKEYNGEARSAFDQVYSQVQVEVEGDAAGDSPRIIDYEDMTPKQKKTYAKGR